MHPKAVFQLLYQQLYSLKGSTKSTRSCTQTSILVAAGSLSRLITCPVPFVHSSRLLSISVTSSSNCSQLDPVALVEAVYSSTQMLSGDVDWIVILARPHSGELLQLGPQHCGKLAQPAAIIQLSCQQRYSLLLVTSAKPAWSSSHSPPVAVTEIFCSKSHMSASFTSTSDELFPMFPMIWS